MCAIRTWAFLSSLCLSAPALADEPRTDRYGDPLPPGAIARLGTVRFRHGGASAPLAEFLPDGKTILSATSDGKLRFWDAATGKLLQVLPTQLGDNYQQCAALSRDGKMVAVGGYKGASLWDVDGRTLLHTLTTERVQSLAFSPDGKTLVTGGQIDGLLRVFDVATGKQRRRMQWHHDYIRRIIVAPDNRTLISAGQQGDELHIGNLESGELSHSITERNKYVEDIALSPDGKSLVVVGHQFGVGGVAEIYDVSSGKRVRSLDTTERRLGRAKFLPGGKELITSAMDGTVTRWDAARWKTLPELPERGWIGAISPDGRTFLRTYGAAIKLFDLATGKPCHDFDGHIGEIRSLAFSSDGKLIASVSDGVRLWDVTTSKTVRKLNDPDWPVRSYAIQTAPGGFLTSYSNGTSRLWDGATGAELRQFSLQEKKGNTQMSVSADGKRILCASLGDIRNDVTITIAVLDFATGKELIRRELEKSEHSLDRPVFSPDGKTYVLRADVGLSLAEFDTGKERCRLLTPDIIDQPILFAPDGRSLAIRSSTLKKEKRGFTREAHKVRVFDTETGKEKFAIPITDMYGPLEFSPDSRLLAAAAERMIVICDAATGRERWRSPEVEHHILSIAFSPKGATLASGHADGNILIWDIARVIDQPGK